MMIPGRMVTQQQKSQGQGASHPLFAASQLRSDPSTRHMRQISTEKQPPVKAAAELTGIDVCQRRDVSFHPYSVGPALPSRRALRSQTFSSL